jgi:RNA polymerase sigma-70 factor (ECF subfamily)
MDELTRLFLEGRAGDRPAFAAWIRRSQADVWRLCAHLVDVDEADDLTQEVFLRAHTAMDAFRGDSSVRTWLLAITRRVCVDAIRRRQRLRRLRRRLTPPEPVGLPSTVEPEDLVRRLEPERREAFFLTQMLGLSYHETADVCGVPVGTIRSRVARARADLMVALADPRTGHSTP